MLLEEEQLQSYLPPALPGFDVREIIPTDNEGRNFICAQVRFYGNSNDASVTTLLCDMLLDPGLYEDLLRCSELSLLSDMVDNGNILAALEPMTNLGTILTTLSFTPQTFSLSSADACQGNELLTMVPYESLTHDVAGWQIALPECQSAVLLLGANQRFVLLALASEVDNGYQVLEDVAAATNFDALEQHAHPEIIPE